MMSNRSDVCNQGRVPVIGVNATTVEDIKQAVKFAARHNLKVKVKNTGHDFLGRGLGPGTFLIWTHHFRYKTFAPDFKYSTGQQAGVPSITLGPGVQWYEAYLFAHENDVTIGGGIGVDGSVGAAGGWPLGGGHNILSPVLGGLGADNILEATIVTPTGSVVTVNKYKNTDLFWALRGGGGPSFGIAVSLTYAVHPKTSLFASFFEAYTDSQESFVALLDTFNAALPNLSDAGWSGYYPFINGQYFALMYLLPNGTPEKGNATLGPWIQTASAIPGVTIATDATTTYPDYYSWLVANILEPTDVIGFNYTAGASFGGGTATASWLIPEEVMMNPEQTHQLSLAMSVIPAGIGQHVGGGDMAKHAADFNAVHPAWRTTLSDISIFGQWKDGASEDEIAATRKSLTDFLAPIRALGGGQYLNEPDFGVPDFPAANWGSNYDRLKSIKAQVDPDNMFIVLQGVGSENWDAEQLCPL